ncbi:purine permease [Nordella sp. HKS 07]|uniref:uracil-xanthine permease family protein n=1 Tax=Nordella sp. HKS 07 TaxID=2712222 RepID=UPI0013E1BD45|nr:solute carrier family 23 protein [Nordella sp. HKS 07]QIG52144.1 purine permease [Nordella sp. HKS 07]
MSKVENEIVLVARLHDRLPMGQTALLGLQHVLAMDVYVVPFIIASVLGLAVADSAVLIQSAFIAAGLATIIQSKWMMRLPVVQGPSYVPIGAILAIAFASGGGVAGLATVFGALIPGAVIVALLGTPTGIFHRVIKKLVPPIVGGTIILVVGMALMPVALKESVFAVYGDATVGGNILLAAVSAIVLVAATMAGITMGKRGMWLRLGAVILALGAGTLVASFMGRFSAQGIADASWLTLPRVAFLTLDINFSFPAILTMLVVYAVVLAETTGTWFAVGAVMNKEITDSRLDRGATGEGLGCLVSALVGSTPVTGYSSNAGVIAITGIGSRAVIVAAGIMLVLFGLVGKLGAAIASIPQPVIGGVFGVLCAVIAMNGFRVVRSSPLSERNMLVVGLPVLLALFATLIPPDYLKTLPDVLQYLLGSSIAFGAVGAILLHQILPEKPAETVSR